jgi:flagellum-specific peptidoglycan hydrolase FlgJ
MRFSALIFLFATITLRAQNPAEAYINKYDSLAVEVMNTYGIPASLVLGVALQESGGGTSKLCRTKHNHFGLKGRVKSSKTKSGYVTAYRSFESDEAAYLFFGKMISSKKYYVDLRCNMDYMKWLKAMKAAKYATSSTWITYVDKMIKRYNLIQFDNTDPFPFIPAPAAVDSVVKMK